MDSKKILKYIIVFLATTAVSFGLQFLFFTIVKNYNLYIIQEWIASILMLVGTVFWGIPAVIGVAVGYGLAGIFNYYVFYRILLLMLSKLVMGIIIYLFSRKLKKLNTMKEIIRLAAFCVFGCFLSFIARFYFLESGYVYEGYMYSLMNYLTSNIACVISIGVPICYLIYRLKNGKDESISRNERVQVKTAMIIMPVFIAIYLAFFLSVQPDNLWNHEYWFKAFLSTTAFVMFFMAICIFLNKWKKITLICVAVILSAFVVIAFINEDPIESILIVLAGVIYIVLRIVFFSYVEEKINLKKTLKGICLGLNIVFIGLFILQAALNEVIAILPLTDYTEKYAIVLGAPVYKGEPSDILEERMNSLELNAYIRPDCIYFVSGGVKDDANGVSEASLVANRLIEKGVPVSNIEIDDKAKTTDENFKNIRKIFDEKGYDKDSKIVIISSPFHYMRATLIAFDNGLNNLSYNYMQGNIVSNFMWAIREAVVYPIFIMTR